MIAFEADRLLETVAEKPFRARLAYQLEDGTIVRARGTADAVGFFATAPQLLRMKMERGQARDLEHLKRRLEQAAA